MRPKNPALGAIGLSALLTLSGACGSDAEAPSSAGGSTGAAGAAGGAPPSSASGAAGSAAVGAAGASGASAGAAGSSVPTSGAGGAGGASAGSGGGSAGAANGGSAGTGAPCASSGGELCEDFETGQLDAARWVQSKSNNTSITVEGGTVHGGKYAVHLKFPAGQQSNVTIAESATFAAPNAPNKFYSRMWIYFGPEIPKAATGDFHTGFMVGGGKNDKGDVIAGMGMIGSDQQWLGYSIFFGNPKYEFGPWSNPRIKAKEWQCVELLEDGTDPSTELRRIWLNDVEMKELASDSAKAGGSANPNHHPPKFDKVIFGILEYHPIPTLSDIWLDDLRVSAQPIGCK